MLKGLIMKKMIMAAAACAFAFSGMAAAADVPAGWTSTKGDDGLTYFKKDATGVVINMVNIPATGYTLESAADEVVKTNEGCKNTTAAQDAANEQDIECADNRMINIIKSGAEQFTMITTVCGKADKAACEADVKEFFAFILSK